MLLQSSIIIKTRAKFLFTTPDAKGLNFFTGMPISAEFRLDVIPGPERIHVLLLVVGIRLVTLDCVVITVISIQITNSLFPLSLSFT